MKDKQECISSVGFDLIERITRGRHDFFVFRRCSSGGLIVVKFCMYLWRWWWSFVCTCGDGGGVLYVPVEMVVEFCMFLWRW